ncbi:MAG TPA: hypothetical protein VJN21_09020 [Candidatus Acidoferrales bacterium]|nr:hypothetical protein [Candidatus Acidoferrales bacterium]
MNADSKSSGGNTSEDATILKKPNLRDPQVVLSLLEADQIVAAKQRTRFGKRHLSLGARTLLWGLRIYVFAMLVIVLVAVVRALHAAH